MNEKKMEEGKQEPIEQSGSFPLQSEVSCEHPATQGRDGQSAAVGSIAVLQPTREWINVNDRLPEQGSRKDGYLNVLGVTKGGTILVCYCEHGTWKETVMGCSVAIPISHWMPLPEPPRQ